MPPEGFNWLVRIIIHKYVVVRMVTFIIHVSERSALSTIWRFLLTAHFLKTQIHTVSKILQIPWKSQHSKQWMKQYCIISMWYFVFKRTVYHYAFSLVFSERPCYTYKSLLHVLKGKTGCILIFIFIRPQDTINKCFLWSNSAQGKYLQAWHIAATSPCFTHCLIEFMYHNHLPTPRWKSSSVVLSNRALIFGPFLAKAVTAN